MSGKPPTSPSQLIPPLREIALDFQLTLPELGALFGVSAEVITTWYNWENIPPTHLAHIAEMLPLIQSLEHKFNQEQLPQVARHKSVAYGNQTLLQLLSEDSDNNPKELQDNAFNF